ncbi:MAG: hypothetical protein ACR2P8_01405 [Myxococcota bacterium]
MPEASDASPDWTARLEALGRELGQREAEHRDALERARGFAEKLRGQVADALERFHSASAAAGAPHLRVELSPIRIDDKHLRAIEFNLVRGRHKAVVVAKARGDVTLVGPFHIGKNEGPCKSFPMESESELQQALGDFLARFVEEAAAP